MISNPTTLIGTANQVLVNGSSGSIRAGSLTLTLPQSIGTSSSPAFTALTLSGSTANAFLYAGTAGLLTSTTAPVNGELLIGNTGNSPVKAALTQGIGITITNGPGTITIANSGVLSFSAGTTGLTPASASTGAVTLSGVLARTNGGTGLSATGTSNQILGVNAAATGLEYKSVTAGTGITVTPSAGGLNISANNNGTVTSVGLSLPSIFTVSGSPVTSSGTLTGALATQAANRVLAGPVSGAAAVPAFRAISLIQNDVADVSLSAPASGQTLTYNAGTSKWNNTDVLAANATGTIGVSPTSGGTAWTLISGTRYRADFVHNLGTTNIVVTLWDTNNNAVVIADSLITTNANTVRVTVVGNLKTIKVVVVANGSAIVANGSTPASVVTAFEGVTVSTAATKLNFTGQAVGVTDAGSGTTNITIGSRFTFFANSLDTPVNADFVVNSIAATVSDPTYQSLNVRSFSNTTEQGVACLISIPPGATTMTIKMRGRSQITPGVASVVQPRLYHRRLPNNITVPAWSTAQELANIAIPTNQNFQYSIQTIALSVLGLLPDNMYQLEFTRRVSGVTGTNLAANYLMAELTIEVS